MSQINDPPPTRIKKRRRGNENMIHIGIQYELEWHLGSLSIARKIRSKYGQLPTSRLAQSTIVAFRPCVVLPRFACVWVKSSAEFSVMLPSSTLSSDSLIMMPGGGCGGGNYKAALLPQVVETVDFDSFHFIALTQQGVDALSELRQARLLEPKSNDDAANDDLLICSSESMMQADHDSNFVIQSAVVLSNPLLLLSYAYYMFQFAVSVSLLMNSIWVERKDDGTATSSSTSLRLKAGDPPWKILRGSPVLNLGMGSNVLGRAMDALLDPAAPIHILEIEPAVVDLCREQGSLETSRPGGFRCHIGDVRTSLAAMPRDCSMIFLDCYDPLASSMMHAQELIAACRDHLHPDGGVLVVNAHVKITEESMAPFVRSFREPTGSVHAVYVQQAFVVCQRRCSRGHQPAADDVDEEELDRRMRVVLDTANAAQVTGAMTLDLDLFKPVRKLTMSDGGSVTIWEVQESPTQGVI